jgi:hypothetical protein
MLSPLTISILVPYTNLVLTERRYSIGGFWLSAREPM